MKSSTKIQGFTLVELLVTVTILGIIGLLFFSTFSSSLRGGNKAQIVLAIKQNGQSLLENLDKTIRGSDNVICVNVSTVVIIKDGIYTRYRFIDSTSSSNGQIQQDNPDPVGLTAELLDRMCTDSMSQTPLILTDTNTTTGVSVQNGSFEREKLSGFKDVIIIQFDVGKGVGVVGGTSTIIDPVHFKTTIQLR